MNPKRVLGVLARTLGIVLGLEVVLSLLIATLANRYNWTTVEEISTAYMWAGILIIGFGFFSLAGFWENTRSFEHQYSISVTNQSSWERTQSNVIDFLQSFRILLWTVAIGSLTLAIAWLLTTLDWTVLNSML